MIDRLIRWVEDSEWDQAVIEADDRWIKKIIVGYLVLASLVLAGLFFLRG